MHDVTDASVLRSWLNNPFSMSLAADIYKATNIVRSWAAVGSLSPEKAIPAAVLHGAAGFAILSVAKVSPPSSILAHHHSIVCKWFWSFPGIV